jgi:hypothetical protein
MSNVYDVSETLGQVTFNESHLLQSDDKVHKKIWSSMEEMIDEADDDDIPMDDILKKNLVGFILDRIVQVFCVSYSLHIVLPLYTSGGV